ncbi:MAG: FHA domain-containing protein [Thalassotalea sp.]
METIIIEEISRNHKLIGRHKFTQRSIDIGRGFNNDIILTDQHVCSDHLTINFDGQDWRITDHNTINGSFIGDKKHPANEHVIRSGDVIRIGKSQIRFYFPDHPIAESLLFSPFEELINLARQPAVFISAILLFSLLNAYLIFLSVPVEVKLTQLIAPVLKTTFIFALWPMGVALVSQLTKNEPRIWAQIGVSFIIYNLFWFSDLSEGILFFNTSSSFPAGLVAMILPLILSFCLFWLNAYVGFQMSNKRRNIVSASLVVLLFGGMTLTELSKKPDFRAHPSYNSTIMSPSFLLNSGSDTESFIKDSANIFKKAKADAHKKKD